MISHHLLQRPAFDIIGKKTWISGPDNSLFARFWVQCEAEGLVQRLKQIGGLRAGPQTNGILLGVSCVEEDPSKRDFYYMIAIEKPQEYVADDLEVHHVPASQWAVFECRGEVPASIVASEIYAFTAWLPSSGYVHAHAPEMEVYLQSENRCEFWLPIVRPA